MRVVNIFYYYDDKVAGAEDLIRYYYTTTGWAEALHTRGVETIIMTRFRQEESYRKNNIQHYFVKDQLGSSFRAWQIPWKFLRKVRELDADIIHVHSLTLSLQTWALRLLLKKKTAIIIQHHGGRSPGPFKRAIHNLFNSVADAYFFTTVEQGTNWFMKKKPFHKVLPVMEGATFFDYERRDAGRNPGYQHRSIARARTGISGSPVLLWAGRLDTNKDPLTILDGFETIGKKYPAASLYMIYSNDQLLCQVQQRISNSATLSKQVHLLGKIAHESIEDYYNSADYFVLGSHYEGSGYALSEALRCGCIPVITHIPSFYMMTNEGQLGALWEAGNPQSFSAAIETAIQKPLLQEANNCIHFYEEHLSFEAIARTAARHYHQVSNARSQ
ncbi:glycosyltransferase family 1 protein [Paraflavitalea soli]|uniref:Glycosyltransferase family 1 protein n=1 Tax=Paraflavitalea soli TaxID=2315862 RepID=A0A3B7MNG0_9BACT|nr:glycosyltransferase family 4 protein [Paraflavitalea soli]AXY75678.1 glycosyltransferase family 1 protein [Paraflavitalea soli]